MNAIWGIVIGQLLLLGVAASLFTACRLAPIGALQWLRTCRFVSVVVFCVSVALALPLLWLTSLVVDLVDHLLVFGVPIGTLGLCAFVIRRAGDLLNAER